ncbi:MAG: hypothetical protein ACKO3H_02020 [Verrucomicrobiota bacterium]
MNRISPRQLVAYLIAIFVFGTAAGAIGGYSWGKRSVARWPDRSKMREKIQAKITADLGLSSEQVARLAPLIDRHMEELDSLNQEHHRQIGASMSRQRDRIAGILTPEQRTVFEAKEREREQRRSRQRGPSTGESTNQGPGNPQTRP